MMHTVHAVALRTVTYSDRNSILTAWTAEHGRMAILLSNANTPEARRRRALTQPMGLFEFRLSRPSVREVTPVSDLRASHIFPSINTHPIRAAIAMFFAEVLTRTIAVTDIGSDQTYAFVTDAVRALDGLPQKSLTNLPLWFLASLTGVMGIAPDMGTYRPGYAFSMSEARFVPVTAAALGGRERTMVSPDDAAAIHALWRLQPRTIHLLRADAAQRRRFLDGFTDYFSLHHAPITGLHSLAVLHTLLR